MDCERESTREADQGVRRGMRERQVERRYAMCVTRLGRKAAIKEGEENMTL